VNKSKKSVIKGIDTVREVMRENKFRVFSTCKYFLEELSLYHYPEAEGIVEDEVPVKENDHLLDALRYAIYTYKPVRRVFEKRVYKSVNSTTGY
jgi:phage terminase large subunit